MELGFICCIPQGLCSTSCWMAGIKLWQLICCAGKTMQVYRGYNGPCPGRHHPTTMSSSHSWLHWERVPLWRKLSRVFNLAIDASTVVFWTHWSIEPWHVLTMPRFGVSIQRERERLLPSRNPFFQPLKLALWNWESPALSFALKPAEVERPNLFIVLLMGVLLGLFQQGCRLRRGP